MNTDGRETCRILIVGNNILSTSTSNGRTLRNFLIGWPKEKLAQFTLQAKQPDFDLCDRYFCTTDGQALRAFLGRGSGGGVAEPQPEPAAVQPAAGQKNRPRTALTMLLREWVWNSRRWTKNGFWQWVEVFKPELVLLQAGDCAFMFRLAEDVARKYDIPLVIYNSEGYYFKDFDYFRGRGLAHWCYPLFRRQYCRQFKKTLAYAAHSIYICDPLKQDYDKVLGRPSTTVYTATQVTPAAEKTPNEVFTTSYLGNLGVGRHKALMDIANALQAISPELHLDVYGRIPNDVVQAAFDACPGIRYKGFVSYEQEVQVMHQSDLLVHGENFDPFWREDLKYGFSTKLADSLASGTCFLLYAPEEMACARYLRDNDAAWVVSDKAELTAALERLVTDPQARQAYIPNALTLVKRNHSTHKCTQQFQDILKSVVSE
ncbi:MAG: glycosyltransferase [Oscillospiraceae bacterium]|nr:glycosyltransferase [Oscillospiraceae bacterium]